MLVNDHRLLRDVDALLRAEGIAQLAANAAGPHKVAGQHGLRVADHDAVTDHMGGVADVEIFALSFVQAKHLQCDAGIAGIDGLHIGVLHKNLVQL